MHNRDDEPPALAQHRRHGRQRPGQVVDVHQRHLAGTAGEWPPVPPAGVAGNVGTDIGDVRRAGRACLVEHRGRDVDSDNVRAQPGQIAAHPALPAGDVQDPFAGHSGQQVGMRSDQWLLTDPLLVPLGELVIPG
jgi:hypothetical protein